MGLRSFIVAISCSMLMTSASAETKEPSVLVERAWTRATPPGARTGAGYLTLSSRSRDDRLLSAESARAGRVELHEMSNTAGLMKMWRLENGLPIPAGKAVSLAPGGTHLMFFDLERPFAIGEKVPVLLRFEKAGVVQTELEVLPLGSKGPSSRPAGRGSSDEL